MYQYAESSDLACSSNMIDLILSLSVFDVCIYDELLTSSLCTSQDIPCHQPQRQQRYCCLLCVQWFCVFFSSLLFTCTLVKMFNLDLNNSQYNLREELGVYDCKYREIENLEELKPKINDLSIIHLNIRGLLNKQDQLKNLVKDTEADVILLCETWLKHK